MAVPTASSRAVAEQGEQQGPQAAGVRSGAGRGLIGLAALVWAPEEMLREMC